MELSHLLPLALLVVPIIWGVYGYFNSSSAGNTPPVSSKKQSPWPLIFNSAVLYALAFNIIFFIQELFLALGKRWLGLKAFLYHNNHNWEGEHPMEGLAQGYGAVAILVTGIICLIIARGMRRSAHWTLLFFLWMSFQGFAQSIPQFITANNARDTDTGQAFTYLGIGDTAGTIIAVAGIIIMLWLLAGYSRFLLQLAPGIRYTEKPQNRFSYLFQIAVAASLIGIALIIPFRVMPWNRAFAPIAVTLISIPMVFANAWRVKNITPVNNLVNQKVFWVPVFVLVALLLVFQLVLAKGVEI